MTRLAFFTALVIFTALPALAQAQGYSGLFAPAPDEQTTPAPTVPKSEKPAAANAPAETYSGLIPAAPAAKGAAKKPAPAATAPATYSGLIAPETGKKAAKAARTATKSLRDANANVTAPQMTPIPQRALTRTTRDIYINGPKPVVNSQDLRAAALFNSLRYDGFDVKKHALTPEASAAIEKRVAEMTDKKGSTERRVDKTVQKLMKEVNDPRISPEERKARAAIAYEKLLKDSDGILARGKATAPIYAQYGMPETLAKQQQDGQSRALETLQQAIRQMDTLRK